MTTTAKVSHFDKAICKALTTDINMALKHIGAKHGVKLVTGKGVYGDTHFTLKLEMTVLDKNGADMDDKRNFERNARKFGLEPEDFRRHFKIGDTEYEIVTISPRATKMPLVVKKVGTEQLYGYPASVVRIALGRLPSKAAHG